jgi:uncharacterized RDD family membrane protein YckC
MTDFFPPSPGVPPPPPPGAFGAPPPGYAAYEPSPSLRSPNGDYAGFFVRFAAYLIDGVITALFAIPAWIALVSGPTRITDCNIDSSGDVTGFGDDANGLCEVPTGSTIAIAVGLGIVALVAVLLYHGKLEGGPSGQTIGKKALGIRVVDANTGGPIGTGRAIGRFLFAQIISGAFCSLGYLWNIWDSRKQTWHDKVTTAVVIKA